MFTSTSCLDDDPLINWDDMISVIELPYKSHYTTLSQVTPEKNETFTLMVNYTIPKVEGNKEDITVNLGVDESMVSSYNATLAASSKKYEMLPASACTVPSSMVISKGTRYTEQQVTVNTASLEPGKYYILPIKITSTSGNYVISGNFGHLYVRVQMK